MYFKARRSTRIKVGKPQPPFKEPIIIDDAPNGAFMRRRRNLPPRSLSPTREGVQKPPPGRKESN